MEIEASVRNYSVFYLFRCSKLRIGLDPRGLNWLQTLLILSHLEHTYMTDTSMLSEYLFSTFIDLFSYIGLQSITFLLYYVFIIAKNSWQWPLSHFS